MSDAQDVMAEVAEKHRPYGLDCKCGRPINSDADWSRHVAAEIDKALARTTEDAIAALLQRHVFWNDESPDGDVDYWCDCGKDMDGSIEWSAHVAEVIASVVHR